MKNCYIHSAVAISAQHTFDGEEFFAEVIKISAKKITAIHPNYKDFIPPASLRRMAAGVKMGFTCAKKALQIAYLEQPEAIITGTGMGCIEDTETFLNAIIENNEAYLTPTAFIQSTHNTVAAQIALHFKCKGYNNTYVHASLSFESALIDAQLMIEQQEATTILVGGVDELGKEFVDYVQLLEEKAPNGISVPFSEGATFFVMSSEKKPDAIEILDVETISVATKEDVHYKLKTFLKDNDMKSENIDAVVLGYNGDVFDNYYDTVASTLFSNTTQLHYKHLVGEYYTSSAFALWLGTKVLQHQNIPNEILKQNPIEKPIETIVLYNQFKGRDHSFILLKKC